VTWKSKLWGNIPECSIVVSLWTCRGFDVMVARFQVVVGRGESRCCGGEVEVVWSNGGYHDLSVTAFLMCRKRIYFLCDLPERE
jgi:hypothetical protein